MNSLLALRIQSTACASPPCPHPSSWWSSQPCIEAPFTLDLTKATLLGVIKEPFLLPNYPSHTQAVERKVRVVTEAATKRVTQSSWHQLILQLEKSRKLVPKFNTKKYDYLIYEN